MQLNPSIRLARGHELAVGAVGGGRSRARAGSDGSDPHPEGVELGDRMDGAGAEIGVAAFLAEVAAIDALAVALLLDEVDAGDGLRPALGVVGDAGLAAAASMSNAPATNVDLQTILSILLVGMPPSTPVR